jgi:hypothetical protein
MTHGIADGLLATLPQIGVGTKHRNRLIRPSLARHRVDHRISSSGGEDELSDPVTVTVSILDREAV